MKFRGSERIGKVESTTENLTGRGGLAAVARYLDGLGLWGAVEEKFGGKRRSRKGQPIWQLFRQVVCFLFDGTSRHLTAFDDRKADPGYAAAIEEKPESLASSHTVKRLFKAFQFSDHKAFRDMLHDLFIWRLQIDKPEVIELTFDSMVMDNDEAQKRQGVQPTYKKVKGFQPLQVVWNRKIVDGLFRGGKKHGNSGQAVALVAKELVELIRSRYRPDVTIVIKADSGFFDEENFQAFDELDVLFVVSGKMYPEVKEQVEAVREDLWDFFQNDRQTWEWIEFGFRCKKWRKFYRAIYTRPVDEDGQSLMDFAKPENVIITNVGVNPKAMQYMTPDARRRWDRPKRIIKVQHSRGADELPHRGLKDFASEQLPFKRFSQNMAYYYVLLLAFFLFESFKEDVLRGLIPETAYPTTVRRTLIDIAAKVVRRAGQNILRIPIGAMKSISFDRIWVLCQNPPPLKA
jgi:hypothetical protein